MASTGDCIGICFADQQLFYAVNNPTEESQIRHIGCIDYNFPVLQAISGHEEENFEGLIQSLRRLQDTWSCSTLRVLCPAILECWSTFPRLVYETSDEREDHIAVLMNDYPRSELEPTWYELSNESYKLLNIRPRKITDTFRQLSQPFSQCDFVSEFELGMEWRRHTGLKGSYLTVNCQNGYLSVASYLLGKLRGATFLHFESVNDLPYLWTFFSRQLSWMNGIHEQVYLYGQKGSEGLQVLSSFLDETGDVILMNRLKHMEVDADETTYGFNLESSFPAVILSLNLSEKKESAVS